MSKVTARVNVKGKHFEIEVDLDEALKIKAGKGDIALALAFPRIFSDMKKGNVAKESDLMDAFGTKETYQIATRIIVSGEVQKTQDFRDSEREMKIKRVIDLLLKNAVDQNGRPYTEERIKRAIEECHYNIDSRAPEQQLPDLLAKLQTVIPIKIETKRVKLTIPAQYTGQAYGVLKDYKESEEWLPNGSLSVILNIPSGMQLDFYDKLNSITHGAVQSEELKEKK
ncbi:MAG TPA: ribosome assembly factor SBDS [Candidatus Nanoarchaeia archaeon]|nr:ribosome assembly factor SBDS [Candidatus Nanoarchaeia archaeon]